MERFASTDGGEITVSSPFIEVLVPLRRRVAHTFAYVCVSKKSRLELGPMFSPLPGDPWPNEATQTSSPNANQTVPDRVRTGRGDEHISGTTRDSAIVLSGEKGAT